MQQQSQQIDHGPTGQAALARSREFVKVATGDARRGKEQAEAVRVIVHPIDHYAQGALLTDRQVDAAWAMVKAHMKGWGMSVSSAAYGERGGADDSKEADQARTDARRRYTLMLDSTPHAVRHALVRVVHGEWPTMCQGLLYLRVALDAVADNLKLPRE